MLGITLSFMELCLVATTMPHTYEAHAVPLSHILRTTEVTKLQHSPSPLFTHSRIHSRVTVTFDSEACPDVKKADKGSEWLQGVIRKTWVWPMAPHSSLNFYEHDPWTLCSGNAQEVTPEYYQVCTPPRTDRPGVEICLSNQEAHLISLSSSFFLLEE